MDILDNTNKLFPRLLKNIKNPPKVLYVEGDISILDKYSIAIVGSRNCSRYGEKWCDIFTKRLIEYDLVITSGMAVGIDTIAHKSTIDAGGKTIAVLPSGFNNIYPKENVKLYYDIISSGGAVISEYSPDVKPSSENFLDRNRIVSGLALGTLVVEAEFRSGTSVTAKMTKEQQKQVFCVPGSLENRKSVGTNKLIQNGAKLITCVEDIVENFSFLKKVKREVVPRASEMERKYSNILDLLSDVPIQINDLVKKSGLTISKVMADLTILELEQKVKRLAGNNYIKM